MPSSSARVVVVATAFAALSSLLAGASCSKTSKGEPAPAAPSDPAAGGAAPVANPDPSAPVGAEAAAAKPATPAKPVAKGKDEPLPGVDVADLKPEAREQFFRLVDSAPSPCGKAQSLRAALKDPTCKRAPWAGNYIKKLSGFGAEDAEALEFYKRRYEQAAPHKFDVSRAAYEGQPSAPIKVVEFFDYGCPHCKLTMPVMEDLVAEYPGQVVVYYMHFPLRLHPQSPSCAAAAIAAQKQNKFRQMHHKLFDIQGNQTDEEIRKAAVAIGLDMKRFDADWKAEITRAQVESDGKQGEAAKLEGTPQLYINGRMYTDPTEFEWIKNWLDEELAVNK